MCRCPTSGDTLPAAGPRTGRMRTCSTRYGMNTTPWANGPGSGRSTISLAAGSLSMGTTVLWAKAAAANMHAETAASGLISRFIAFSPLELSFGDSIRYPERLISPAFELAQRLTAREHGGHEQLRLFPRREVSAFGEPVVVDQLGIRLLSPTLRRLVDLFGESAHGDRDLDAPHVEEAAGRKIMPGVPVEAC